MVTLSPSTAAREEEQAPQMVRQLDRREQATKALQRNGWTLLYTGLTSHRASVTLLDPSESLQISLQIPIGDESEDWNLWLEACQRHLSQPLRQWLEAQGVEQATLSRLSGVGSSGEQSLKLSNMLQVARWLQEPIGQIEQLADESGSQLVLHLAGLGPNS